MHGRPGHPAVNALRLALGTLTVLPVRPPTSVDRRTAGRAMVLAPLVGLLLGVLVLALLWVLGGGTLFLLGPGEHTFGSVGEGRAAPLVAVDAGRGRPSSSRSWPGSPARCTSTGSPTSPTVWAPAATPAGRWR